MFDRFKINRIQKLLRESRVATVTANQVSRCGFHLWTCEGKRSLGPRGAPAASDRCLDRACGGKAQPGRGESGRGRAAERAHGAHGSVLLYVTLKWNENGLFRSHNNLTFPQYKTLHRCLCSVCLVQCWQHRLLFFQSRNKYSEKNQQVQ